MVAKVGYIVGQQPVTGSPGQTQDYTIAGFGTPVAAMARMVNVESLGSDSFSSTLSRGFTDGTNMVYASCSANDIPGASDTRHRMGTDRFMVGMSYTTGLYNAAASFNSWVTDGIRVTWDEMDASDERYFVIMLIGGDAEATVGWKQASATDQAEVDQVLSHSSDIMWTVTDRRNTTPDTSVNNNSTYGFGVARPTGSAGTAIQHSWGFDNLDAADPTNVRASVDTNRIVQHFNASSGAGLTQLEIRDFDQLPGNGFTIKTHTEGTGSIPIGFLAVDLKGLQAWSGITTTPTAATPVVHHHNQPGFKPQICEMNHTYLTTADTVTGDATAGSFGSSWLEDGQQYSFAFTNEDGHTAPNNATQVRAQALYLPKHDGGVANIFNAVKPTSPSEFFTSAGVQLRYTDHPGTSRQCLMWAIEEDTSITISPPGIGAGASVPNPTVIVDLGVIAPPALAGGAAFPNPSASFASPTLSPPSLAAGASFPLPGVGFGGDGTFFDHMAPHDQVVWEEISAVGGFSNIDGYTEVNGPSSTSHFLRYGQNLPTLSSWMMYVTFSAPDNTIAVQAPFTVWASGSGAPSAPLSVTNAEARMQVEITPTGVHFQYRQAAGSFSWWGPSGWQSFRPTVSPVPLQSGTSGDWYGAILEYDQPGSRIRFLAVNRNAATYSDTNQGYRVSTITDWVATSALPSWDDLWFTMGHRATDTGPFNVRVEFVKYVSGSVIDAFSNNRLGFPGQYKLYHEQGVNDGSIFTEHASIDPAYQAWEDGNQGRRSHPAYLDGSNIRIVYESFKSGDTDTEIGVMSSSDPDATFTNSLSNPIIQGSDLGTGYSDLRPAAPMYDTGTSKFRIYIGAEHRSGGVFNEYRCFVLESDAFDGTYTKLTGPFTDGAIFASITPQFLDGAPQFGIDGFSDPFVYWDPLTRVYHCWPAGYRAKGSVSSGTSNPNPWDWDWTAEAGWAVFHATSGDGVNWTFTDGGLPIVQGSQSRILQVLSTVPGAQTILVTNADSAGLTEDWPVFLRDDDGSDVLPSRVRSRPSSNTLTLYHWIEGATGSSTWEICRADAGSITATGILPQLDGTYALYVTVFQPFINTPLSSASGDHETMMRLTAPSLDGPWSWDLESGFPALTNTVTSTASKENFSFPAAEINTTTIDPPALSGGAAFPSPDVILPVAFESTTPTISFTMSAIQLRIIPDTVVTDTGTWWDTGPDNGMEEVPSLFTVRVIGDKLAYTTGNTGTNVHSHYLDATYDITVGDVEFAGKMMAGTDPDSLEAAGIGVTFLSGYGDGGVDTYYRLRRGNFAPDYNFVINTHHGATSAVWAGGAAARDTGVNPTPGVWYNFKVNLHDTGSATQIQAKVWVDGDPEPAGWQADDSDSAASRFTSGRIGLWAMGVQEKAWAEMTVNGTPIPLEQAFELSLLSSSPVLSYDTVPPETATMQVLATFPFLGAQDVTTSSTFNNSHPAYLDIVATSTPAIATAKDGGGSQTVTVTATYQAVQAPQVQFLVIGEVTTGEFQTQVTDPGSGITWFFNQAYRVGQFVLGDWWVKPETDGLGVDPPGATNGVIVTAVLPAPSAGRNGSMLNPPVDQTSAIQAYDSRNPDSYDVGYLELSGSTVTMNPEDSLVSTISRTGETVDIIGKTVSSDLAFLANAAVLSCVDNATSLTATTLRPAYASSSNPPAKVYHDASSLAISQLPKAAFPAGSSFRVSVGDANVYQRYANVYQRPWILNVRDFVGRYFHPMNNMPNYWQEVWTSLGDGLTLAWTDPATLGASELDRFNMIAGLVQVGLDAYRCGELSSDTTDSSYCEGPVRLAGFLLGDLGMQSPNYSHRRPNSQCAYNTSGISMVVTSSTPMPITAPTANSPSANAQAIIGLAPHTGAVDGPHPGGTAAGASVFSWMGAAAASIRSPGSQTIWRQHPDGNHSSEHLNPREWQNTVVGGQPNDGWALENYRRANVHTYVAPLMLQKVIYGAQAEVLWNRPALWDYVERWMGVEAADESQNFNFIRDLALLVGEGVPVAKPPGQTGSSFVTNMYNLYYGSPPPLNTGFPFSTGSISFAVNDPVLRGNTTLPVDNTASISLVVAPATLQTPGIRRFLATTATAGVWSTAGSLGGIGSGVVTILGANEGQLSISGSMSGSISVYRTTIAPQAATITMTMSGDITTGGNCGTVQDPCKLPCVVDIWNLAMTRLSQKAIVDQNETSVRARRIRTVWHQCRQKFIRDSHWNGAFVSGLQLTEIEGGAAHTGGRWRHAFELPSCDMLTISVNPYRQNRGDSDFHIALSADHSRTVLYSNVGTVVIEYLKDIDNVEKLDPSARWALGLLIAWTIAGSFGYDENQIRAIADEYREALGDARSADSQESKPPEFNIGQDLLSAWRHPFGGRYGGGRI